MDNFLIDYLLIDYVFMNYLWMNYLWINELLMDNGDWSNPDNRLAPGQNLTISLKRMIQFFFFLVKPSNACI